MGKHVGMSLILMALLFLTAWVSAAPEGLWRPEPDEQAQTEKQEQQAEHSHLEEETLVAQESLGGARDGAMMLRVLVDGQVQEMDMGTYLVGVVRSEMPAAFSLEALKAQAVAARTYTLHKIENGGSANHPQADACDDITCCKAYMEQAEAAANWGAEADTWEKKIRRAVAETDGECVIYEGHPILAVFHSSAVGYTQAAADVWGGNLPYLQSVQTPETGDMVPNYHSTASFQAAALKALLLQELPQANLSGRASDWFTNMQLTESGAVRSLQVGGQEISGNRLRTLLGLRSASFTLSFEGEEIIFSVTGYGHGVGMSQYGANALAADGIDYREILAWYYTDTTVEQYSINQ